MTGDRTLVLIGAVLFTLALVAYLVAIGGVVISGRIRRASIPLQAVGVVCDAAATACMVVYTGTPLPDGVFGWVGYLAWLAMVAELAILVRLRRADGVGRPVKVFSIGIVVLWLVVYFWGFAQ